MPAITDYKCHIHDTGYTYRYNNNMVLTYVHKACYTLLVTYIDKLR